jgi:cell division protein FtsB
MAVSSRNWAQRISKLLALISGVGVVCLLGYHLTASRALERARTLEGELQDVRARNEALATSNERLRLRVQALKNDPRMLEKLAREDYQLIKPEETVYLFPPDFGTRAPSASTPRHSTPRHSAAAPEDSPPSANH